MGPIPIGHPIDMKIERIKSNLSYRAAERIMRQYEATLKIPKIKSKKPILICSIGLVGAGKTTVLRPLSKKLSLIRISTDEIRKMLKERGYDYNRSKELAIRLVEKYIRRGYGAAIDADCISEESQKYIRALKSKYKIKVFWVHINPPEKFIINKLKSYKHTWLFRDVKQAIANYKKRKSLHKNLKLQFIYEFDPPRTDLAEQIRAAAKIISFNM